MNHPISPLPHLRLAQQQLVAAAAAATHSTQVSEKKNPAPKRSNTHVHYLHMYIRTCIHTYAIDKFIRDLKLLLSFRLVSKVQRKREIFLVQ